MDFEFTSDQKMLRASVADFLKKECPYDAIKEIYESTDGHSPDLWKKMAKLEWMGVNFPEEYDGIGDPFMSLCIILEEMGRAGLSTPFFSTVALCGPILLAGASEKHKKKLIKQIIGGKLIFSANLYAEEALFAVDTGISCEVKDGGLVLNGKAVMMPHANVAGRLLAATKSPQGEITLCLVDPKAKGITIRHVASLGNDNLCFVDFDQVPVKADDVIGEIGQGGAILDEVRSRVLVASCAEMLGGCRAAVDLSVNYAKQRVQYGVPIGGQQAIQHRLADMTMFYDTSLHYFYKLVWMIEQEMDCFQDACALKARLNERYNFIGYHGVRIHGSVGLTDEFSIGLYFRRAKFCEFAFGSTQFLFERVADKLLN